jgi:hypothetical protein
MMAKKSMTVEEHLELAKKLRPVRGLLLKTTVALSYKFGKNSRPATRARRALTKFDELRLELDYEYHLVATAEDFNSHKHVYYGG